MGSAVLENTGIKLKSKKYARESKKKEKKENDQPK